MFYLLGVRHDSGPYKVTDEKTGEIKEGDYDNLNFFYASDDMKTTKNTKSACGNEGFFAKIKREDCVKIFGFEIFDCKQLECYCMQPIDVIYNRNGDITKVIFDNEAVLKSQLEPSSDKTAKKVS